MNVLASDASTELVIVALQPGEMLLECIREALAEKYVRNGVVISGIGTLKNLRMHYILHTDFPAEDTIVNIERPLELVAVSGIIADGEAHLHVTVSCGQTEVWCGHLEPGSEVAYLAEIAILKCNDLAMVRQADEGRRVKLLGPKSRFERAPRDDTMDDAKKKTERVLAALSHQEPDRVPIGEFFWTNFIRRCRAELDVGDDFDPYAYWDLDLTVVNPNMDPHITGIREVERTAEHTVVKTGFEATIEVRDDCVMPRYLDFETKTYEQMAAFEEALIVLQHP